MASDDAALLGEAGGCGPSAARLCAVFGDGGAGGLPVQEAACFIETAVSPGRPARRVAPSVGFAATSPEVFPSGEERWRLASPLRRRVAGPRRNSGDGGASPDPIQPPNALGPATPTR